MVFNILLMGNGFDLHYKFPTKYINFLHVVDFLTACNPLKFTSVGDVFGQKDLRKIDPTIEESYEQYRNEYDSTLLDNEVLQKIVDAANQNLWFSYLRDSCNKDVKWIDFEKEIGRVLESFKVLLACSENKYIRKEKLSKGDLYILKKFGFWFDEGLSRSSDIYKRLYIDKNYLLEVPLNSNNYLLNKDAVVRKLLEEANNFAEILRLYMHQFIDLPLEQISKRPEINKVSSYLTAQCPITLNYTHTYEKIYGKKAIHLHGNADERIILGINPDADDNLETVDTTFAPFKKYYQRVQYNTDSEYLAEINKLSNLNQKKKKNLIVFGHSLDETDKDIIEDLFDLADLILIFYHSKSSLASQISNLINIFGLEKFNSFRRDRLMRFYQISSIEDVRAFEEKEISSIVDDEFDKE